MPRVFFSYAHESDEHKDQVLALAHFLTAHGIEVDLDQWAGPDRQDWGAWALRHIESADFVVLVASPDMRVAGDGHAAGDTRRGLQYETAAIRDLLQKDRPTWVRKLLPVVLPGGSIDDIPLFMQPYAADHYVLRTIDRAGTEYLLRALTRQPRDVAPPLGAIPHLPPRPAPVFSTRLSWPRLATAVSPRWRRDLVPTGIGAHHSTVELHLVPVPATDRCGVRRLEQLGPDLAALLGVDPTRSGSSQTAAWVHAADGTPGLAATREGQRSAWFPLPRPEDFGTVLDRDHLVDSIRGALDRLVAIGLATPARVAPALGLDPVGVLRDGRTLRMPTRDLLRLDPEDTVDHAELVDHAGEVAEELAARLIGRVREVSGGAGG